jgi:hypothetical protein
MKTSEFVCPEQIIIVSSGWIYLLHKTYLGKGGKFAILTTQGDLGEN